MDHQDVLDTVHVEVAPHVGCGRVAEDIPALTKVDATRFGLALATVDGAVYGAGEWQTPFSIQSMSKVFLPRLGPLPRGRDDLPACWP